MFQKILIANRGEIACRVIRTAREMGVATVAVFSDADASALHVRMADEAIALGGLMAKDSYLQIDKIIAAAQQTGAQAIHPGYGFLSENEAFASACAAAGLVFIGPPVEAIRAMGSKAEAKAIMGAAGVPLTPGYHGDNQNPGFLQTQADAIGYPVLIKASAGGGGKGMSLVETADDFQSALASCQREAQASFGDDRVLIEKYIVQPRHIEVQIFGDQHGHYVHLFERDCSVQRRHQKVLEEAPAPHVPAHYLNQMRAAAIAAARAVQYVGAGTVEFIAHQSGEFYFMEMNTRLQVEHPVTEMITGLDLVAWQLRVASGETLPLTQEHIACHGHALEARVYAEDPDQGFLPATGTISALRFPEGAHADVRIDSGIVAGDAISPYYDPMIAKVIVHGTTREDALRKMQQVLAQCEVVGLRNNIAFLRRLVGCPAFVQADLDTALIERARPHLFPPADPINITHLMAAAAWHLSAEDSAVSDTLPFPWQQADGWRVHGHTQQVLRFEHDHQTHDLQVTQQGQNHWAVWWQDQTFDLRILDKKRRCLCLQLGSWRGWIAIQSEGKQIHVFDQGATQTFRYLNPFDGVEDTERDAGNLSAPMPGTVIKVMVAKGDHVCSGDALLILEAMKMEHTIAAPTGGAVTEICFAVGDLVAAGDELVQIEVE